MSGPSTEELKRAIAAIFLGEGREKMSEEEMLMAISLKRRWFFPETARVMIENGKISGLLRKNGKYLSPTFDYKEIEIPFAYYPPEELAEPMKEDFRDSIIKKLNLSEEEVEKALSMDYNVHEEVKLILWAAMDGREYMHLIDDVEKELIKRIT